MDNAQSNENTSPRQSCSTQDTVSSASISIDCAVQKEQLNQKEVDGANSEQCGEAFTVRFQKNDRCPVQEARQLARMIMLYF